MDPKTRDNWLRYLAIWVCCCSGWTEAFTVVVAGDEVINGKPAPDMWGFYPCCELPNHLSIITELSQHLDWGFWFSSFALLGWIALSFPVLCWWSLWATWQISGSCKAVECRPNHVPCHWRCSVSLYYSHSVLCHRLLLHLTWVLNAQTLLQCFSVVLAVIGISEKRKKKVGLMWTIGEWSFQFSGQLTMCLNCCIGLVWRQARLQEWQYWLCPHYQQKSFTLSTLMLMLYWIHSLIWSQKPGVCLPLKIVSNPLLPVTLPYIVPSPSNSRETFLKVWHCKHETKHFTPKYKLFEI